MTDKKVKTFIKFEGTIELIEDAQDVKDNPMTNEEYAEDLKSMLFADLSEDLDEADSESVKVTIKVTDKKETAV